LWLEGCRANNTEIKSLIEGIESGSGDSDPSASSVPCARKAMASVLKRLSAYHFNVLFFHESRPMAT